LLRGVPRVGSPTSSLLLRHSDSPSPPLRSLSLTRRFRLRDDDRASQVPGEPSPCMPRSSTPAGPLRRASSGCALLLFAAMLPSNCGNSVGSCIADFEAASRGLHARCLRLVVTVTRVLLYDHARLASGWWPSLAGRDSNPLGSIVKFPSCCVSTWLPPHPGLAWRTTATVRERSAAARLDGSAPVRSCTRVIHDLNAMRALWTAPSRSRYQGARSRPRHGGTIP